MSFTSPALTGRFFISWVAKSLRSINPLCKNLVFSFFKGKKPLSVSKVKGDSDPEEQCPKRIGLLTFYNVLIFNFEFASPLIVDRPGTISGRKLDII